MTPRVRSVLCASVLVVLGCSRPPRGMFGHAWGDAPAACATWQPWIPSSGFESCAPPTRGLVFGRAAAITTIRSAHGIEGYSVQFATCEASGRPALRRAITEAFHREAADEVFVQWEHGEVLRLEEQGDGCTLMVAGPRLGPHYVSSGIALGLSGLFRVH